MEMVPKPKKNPEPELPKDSKKYEDMDSKKLSMELKDLDLKKQTLEAQDLRIRDMVIKFMNDQRSEEFTASVFEGGRFDPRRMRILDRELVLTSNLRNYVSALLTKALEGEMTEKFCAINTQLKGVVTSLSVQPTHVGDNLMVTVGGQADLAEPEVKEQVVGVTTSESIGKFSKK